MMGFKASLVTVSCCAVSSCGLVYHFPGVCAHTLSEICGHWLWIQHPGKNLIDRGHRIWFPGFKWTFPNDVCSKAFILLIVWQRHITVKCTRRKMAQGLVRSEGRFKKQIKTERSSPQNSTNFVEVKF
ncbi:uncharacterized protein LOC107053147 [Gallus gallus]|uniref:uncharacterized protein LOC107053147 n=1 Tax=Gallus gallus TaxID=9031 RepID=UPI001F0066C8|nr:uncharacterized protein LOC107053147 [Gallus gallus]